MDVQGNTRGATGEIQYLDWHPSYPEPASSGNECVLITPSNAGSGNWATHDCVENHLFVCAKG